MYFPKKYKHSIPNPELPRELWNCISDFCEPKSYLHLGLVNRVINSTFEFKSKETSLSLCLTNVSLFKEALENNVSFPDDLIEKLAILDSPDLLKIALLNGFEWDPFCVEQAMASSSKNFFRWLKTTDLFWLPENAHSFAAYNGDLEMMKFLVEEQIGYPDNVSMTMAIGKDDIIEFLKNIECNNMYKMVNAIRSDDLETFKLVWEHMGVVHKRAIVECCYYGSIEILTFLVDIGHYPEKSDLCVAIEYSRTNLFYLFGEERPELMDESCTDLAYFRGDYKTLRVLVDMEVYVSEDCFRELESYEKLLKTMV